MASLNKSMEKYAKKASNRKDEMVCGVTFRNVFTAYLSFTKRGNLADGLQPPF